MRNEWRQVLATAAHRRRPVCGLGQLRCGRRYVAIASCPLPTGFLVVRFSLAGSPFQSFLVGKPDSLGFTRKTATPQPSTKPGTPPRPFLVGTAEDQE